MTNQYPVFCLRFSFAPISSAGIGNTLKCSATDLPSATFPFQGQRYEDPVSFPKRIRSVRR